MVALAATSYSALASRPSATRSMRRSVSGFALLMTSLISFVLSVTSVSVRARPSGVVLSLLPGESALALARWSCALSLTLPREEDGRGVA